MKKVAFITSHPGRLGGVETITQSLIKELTQSFRGEYEFTFIAPYLYNPYGQNFINEPKDIDGIRIINLTNERSNDKLIKKDFSCKIPLVKNVIKAKPFRFLFRRREDINELEKVLRKEKFDIVVMNKPYYAICLSVMKKFEPQPIKILWWHSDPKFMFLKNGVYYEDKKIIESLIKNDFIDGNVTLTNNMQKSYKDMINLDSKIISNCTDLMENNFKLNLKKIQKIGYVGRMVEISKQVTHVIEAFDNANNNLELYLYGKGPDRKHYKRLCARLERIYFMERVDNKDEIFDNIDVLVLTSKYEGFGLVIIEAFARGIPVIAYNIDNVNEIMEHNVNGLLVEANNVSKLTEAINSLTSDINFYKELSKNAFQSSKKYGVKDFAIEWDAYFNELLKNKK